MLKEISVSLELADIDALNHLHRRLGLPKSELLREGLRLLVKHHNHLLPEK